MKKLMAGMIGCGGIARTHAERLKAIKEAEIAAFADVIKEKAEVFSKYYGGRAYADWREMLEKEKLDILYVCLPPFAHSDEVEVAAENGIHIFIEKPIALNMKSAWNMVRAVEKNDVKSQVGYCVRFGYAVERIKDLIDAGEAGEVGLAVGWYWCHFLGRDWWKDRSRSGGQIVEQSTHLYDVFRYLCGDVEEIYGHMNRIFWTDISDMTVEDVNCTIFRFKSGAIGSISATTWGAASQWWLRWLMATRKYTLYAEDANTLSIYSTERRRLVKEWDKRDVYLLESKDLIRAIINDDETRTPIREGAKTLELTLAARRSMEMGRPVRLPLSKGET